MTTKPHPHRLRVLNIKGAFLLIALSAALAVWLAGCSPHHGCSATKHMKGFGWIHCKETGVTCYFNKDGKLVHICKK
jgi:hypothetical protein